MLATLISIILPKSEGYFPPAIPADSTYRCIYATRISSLHVLANCAPLTLVLEWLYAEYNLFSETLYRTRTYHLNQMQCPHNIWTHHPGEKYAFSFHKLISIAASRYTARSAVCLSSSSSGSAFVILTSSRKESKNN